jgi:hypothetical protein
MRASGLCALNWVINKNFVLLLACSSQVLRRIRQKTASCLMDAVFIIYIVCVKKSEQPTGQAVFRPKLPVDC